MVNLRLTKDAILALNNSFKLDVEIPEEDRIIEFAITKEKGQEGYSHALWNIYPEELDKGVFHKISLPEEAEFKAVIAGEFIKFFEGIEVDYNIVYSELKEEEGEVFIFRKQESEDSNTTK